MKNLSQKAQKSKQDLIVKILSLKDCKERDKKFVARCIKDFDMPNLTWWFSIHFLFTKNKKIESAANLWWALPQKFQFGIQEMSGF